MEESQELLEITGYSDNEFKVALKGKPYVVMINPDSIIWERNSECSEKTDIINDLKTDKCTSLDELSFCLIIDCTGIVDSSRTNMAEEIKALNKTFYSFNGGIHCLNLIKIKWGKNITFKSKLKTFNTLYTLFKPNGDPIRAKITLNFGN